MCRTPLGRLSVTLLLLLAMGCAASSLQLTRGASEPYVADLRAEYLRSRPDSPYCTQVSRGEVVAGMDMFGVLAAWGHPVRRARENRDFEQWVYLDVDEDSGDAVEYSLAFVEGILDGWKTRVHKSGGLAYRWDEKTTPPTKSEPPGGKQVPQD
jgi:hypothetical protein